jgi:hypothetical protein
MALNFYILFLIVTGVIFLASFVYFRKKSVAVELFSLGIRNENCGRYEEAVTSYETALDECLKNRSRGDLKNKIIQRIKVLQTVLEYNKNFLSLK